jgi:hypothetical protein
MVLAGCTDTSNDCPYYSLGDRLEVRVTSSAAFDLLIVKWGGFGAGDRYPTGTLKSDYTVVYATGSHPNLPGTVVVDAQLTEPS